MLVTTTIRRKMLFWLGTLIALLVGLSVSSVQGLRSYRTTVKDLEFSIRQAPRRSDLVVAISSIMHPLRIEVPHFPGQSRDQLAKRQYEELVARLADAREQIVDFEHRLTQMPRTANSEALERSAHRALRGQLAEKLSQIDAALQGLSASLVDREERIGFITRVMAELMESIHAIPDPSNELAERLETAKEEYRWHLWIVWTTGIASFVLVAVLVLLAKHSVIDPLTRLHQGALRVAHGDDFDFRLEAATGDEISELADAFNKMTSRFQAVTADLDAQVQQRSRQLVQSERLAGVGFLAAGVAHEINNPLSAIVGAADSLEWRLTDQLDKFAPEDADVIKEYLGMMQSEALRCRKITEKLLNFARGSDSERNQYDVTAIVHEVLAMTNHVGRFRDRQLEFERTTPCYAWVNGSEIKQVVLNLVANALEATGENGRVTVRLHECPNHIELTVTDDGIGMGQDVIRHIFEPFFTRREAGKGTGLGLSISHRIVQDHGGSLEASSEGPGKGSTFRLRLPSKPIGASLTAA